MVEKILEYQKSTANPCLELAFVCDLGNPDGLMASDLVRVVEARARHDDHLTQRRAEKAHGRVSGRVGWLDRSLRAELAKGGAVLL